jgi:ABC-type spermidine/putrescine transport system permease subunit I
MRLRSFFATTTLLGLPVAWLVAFFVVPIAIVGAYSFDVYSLFPGKHGARSFTAPSTSGSSGSR